jgi:glycosyltransferase involved in cell wall biosynthesis
MMERFMETSAHEYFGGYVLRKFCSFAPYLSLVPKANAFPRKDGISALVKTRNEPWIVPSLVSIKDFADEIILVDSSTDSTLEKIKKAVDEYGVNVNYIHRMCDIREAYKVALGMSRCKWLLKWDGDFIAYTSRINKLKDHLTNLSEEKYYIIEFSHICVDLDFFHVDKRHIYHTEGWLFTYSPILHAYVEKHAFPRYFEKKLLKDVYAMHLRTVKPALRVFDNCRQGEWTMEADKEKFSNSYQEYLKYCMKQKYGTDHVNALAQKQLENLKEFLVPYDGDYPKTLRDYIKKEFGVNVESWKMNMLEA